MSQSGFLSPKVKVLYNYPWGDEQPSCQYAHLLGCEPLNESQPSCTKSLGRGVSPDTCDLIGNVSEWVADQYLPTYLGAPDNHDPVPFDSPICEQGSFINDAGQQTGVVKGGHRESPPAAVRPNNRVLRILNTRSTQLGFRVAGPIGH